MKKYLKRIYGKSKEEFYTLLNKDLKTNHKRFIVTVNPESLMLAQNDRKMHDLLLARDSFLVPDGIAVVKACHKLDIPVCERITGIDTALELLKMANEYAKSIYLFGAKEEVGKALVKKIKEEYPHIKVLGFTNGYGKNKEKVMEKIIKLEPDICLVALGIPEQEKIIYNYLPCFKKGIFMGVGGAFDVMSGHKKRAPKIFRKLNLEWLYRIIKEPKRIKRFWQNNVMFLFKIKK